MTWLRLVSDLVVADLKSEGIKSIKGGVTRKHGVVPTN